MLGKICSKLKEIKKNRRDKKLVNRIYNNVETFHLAGLINYELKKYRNCFNNKTIYVIGNGPSEKTFNPKVIDYNNSIVIGINRAFKDGRIKFDFLFAQDEFPEGFDEFLDYRKDECVKFMGIVTNDDNIRIRLKHTYNEKVERYVLSYYKMENIPYDISILPFADLRGTVFSALQFALYTNPSKIMLVGFDCGIGHAFKDKSRENFDYQLESWKLIKKYIDSNWKEIEVVSVNPVALKGLFNDIYLK